MQYNGGAEGPLLTGEIRDWDPMPVIAYCRQDVFIQKRGPKTHKTILRKFYQPQSSRNFTIDIFCGLYATLASACSATFLEKMYDQKSDGCTHYHQGARSTTRSARPEGVVTAVLFAPLHNFSRIKVLYQLRCCFAMINTYEFADDHVLAHHDVRVHIRVVAVFYYFPLIFFLDMSNVT